ncbi:MAG: hypothetical protein WBZ36_00665 [Candidatus Nitrosopolaris sp.]
MGMKRISGFAGKSFRRMDTTATIFILIHVSISSADRIFNSGVDNPSFTPVGMMDVGYSFMAHL